MRIVRNRQLDLGVAPAILAPRRLRRLRMTRAGPAGRALLVLVTTFALLGAGPNFGDPMLAWANPLLFHEPDTVVLVRASRGDYFGSLRVDERPLRVGGLADHGGFIPTASKGSEWFYDPAHHLAAATLCCEWQGDLITVILPPPRTLPTRDLSAVHSHLGLRLGMSPVEVVNILGIDRSVLAKLQRHRVTLAFQRRSATSFASFDGNVTFVDGKAVQIELGIAHG